MIDLPKVVKFPTDIILVKATLAEMADSLNQPRPRPRPKRKAVNVIPASTPGASSSSGGLAPSPTKRRVTEVEDTDEMFMRNRNRTSKTWQRLAEINKGEDYCINQALKCRNFQRYPELGE